MSKSGKKKGDDPPAEATPTNNRARAIAHYLYQHPEGAVFDVIEPEPGGGRIHMRYTYKNGDLKVVRNSHRVERELGWLDRLCRQYYG